MRPIKAIAAILVLSACHRSSALKESPTQPRTATAVSAVSASKCVEARKRAAAKPDLDVDKLPSPIQRKPPAFQNMPPEVKSEVDKKGAVVKVDVIVDTLGRADMKTFKVVEATNPWLVDDLKTVLPAWRFSPARLGGCKVRRVYKFSMTAPPRA